MITVSQLNTLLKKENSKKNAALIAETLQSGGDISILFEILSNQEHKYLGRAAYVLHTICDANPESLKPHVQAMYELAINDSFEATTRACLRYFAKYGMEEDYQSGLLDLSLQKLLNPHTPTAIQLWALEIVNDIAHMYRDLAPELLHNLNLFKKHAKKGVQRKTDRYIQKIKFNFIDNN